MEITDYRKNARVAFQSQMQGLLQVSLANPLETQDVEGGVASGNAGGASGCAVVPVASAPGVAGDRPDPRQPLAAEAQPMFVLAFGEAAEVTSPGQKGMPLPPPCVGLRCVQWNPNPQHDDWLACGGSSGMLVLMRLPLPNAKADESDKFDSDDEVLLASESNDSEEHDSSCRDQGARPAKPDSKRPRRGRYA